METWLHPAFSSTIQTGCGYCGLFFWHILGLLVPFFKPHSLQRIVVDHGHPFMSTVNPSCYNCFQSQMSQIQQQGVLNEVDAECTFKFKMIESTLICLNYILNKQELWRKAFYLHIIFQNCKIFLKFIQIHFFHCGNYILVIFW